MKERIPLREQLGYDKVWLVVNPNAGPLRRRRRWQRNLDRIQQYIADQGLTGQTKFTEKKGDGARMIREAHSEGVGLVVLVGGDGLANETLLETLALGEGAPELAVVPAGSENIAADAFKVPSNPFSAIKKILHGDRRKVDIGIITNGNEQHAFLTNAGFDTDAEVIRRMEESGKRGRIVYTREAIKTRREFQPTPLKLIAQDAQGEVIDTHDAHHPRVTILNNVGNYGGMFRITEGKVNDRTIEAAMLAAQEYELLKVFGAIAPVALLRRWIHFLDKIPYVEQMKGASYTIESGAEIPFQVDGEYKGKLSSGARVTTEQIVFRMPSKAKDIFVAPTPSTVR